MCKIRTLLGGMLLGSILTISVCYFMNNNTKIKRKANRAMHSFGDLMESVPEIFQ